MNETLTDASAPRRTVWIALRARKPWVTRALVLANVLVFAVAFLPGGDAEGLAWRYGQFRELVWLGEYWRILTGMFIHAGLGHLTINMLALVLVGRVLERVLGHARFAATYLIAGVAGAFAFQVFSSGQLGLGASGAVFGTFGALLVLRAAVRGGGGWRSLRSFLLWAAFILLFDYGFAAIMEAGGAVLVATSAHDGGFAAGALLGFVFLAPIVAVAPRWQALRPAAGAALLGLMVVLGTYALTVEPRDPQRPRRDDAILGQLLRDGSLELAVERWLSAADVERRMWKAVGYEIFGHTRKAQREDLGERVLDALIDAGLRKLRGPPGPESAIEMAELLNDTAWFMALRGKDLPEARWMADRAVERTQETRPAGPWQWILPQAAIEERLGTYINTRGWIDFLLGNTKDALRDLKQAAALYPTGANFLFLAWAYYALGDLREAEDALRRARLGAEGLSTFESLLLEELEGNIRGS